MSEKTRVDDPRAAADAVRQTVREGYARVATAGDDEASCGCCGEGAKSTAFGYAPEELAELPQGADLGLGCGNPTAIAALKPGQVVLDLGSGGGLDVFLAAQQVGPSGRAIGVDMTPEMIQRARRNAAAYRERTGQDNVEFRLGEIEHLPVADAGVDVVISNCVLNLSPDKEQVWRDIARVLRPGGRVAVSDLALLRPLPRAIQELTEALCGCISGAVTIEETLAQARGAGLADVQVEPKPGYVAAMDDWDDPLYRKIVENLPPGTRAEDFITSVYITARKP